MTRWRVKASRYRPNWFHACEVHFMDAIDAHDAKAVVEADPELRVWAITPATPQMEADYLAWKASCDAWIARNRSGEGNHGQAIRAY